MFCGFMNHIPQLQFIDSSEGSNGRDPPDVKSIKGWHDKFKETGSVGDKRRSERPGVSDETVDTVRTAFQRSPQETTRHASRETAYLRASL